jgi:hypothetical protein
VKRAIALIALAACQGSKSDKPKPAAAPPPVEGDVLKLEPQAPAVGMVIHEDSTQSSSMTLTLNGASSMLTEDTHEVSTSQVLDVADGAITKVRIGYDVKETRHSLDGKDTLDPSPLEGHSYQVWIEGGQLKAAREDGTAVSDAEAEALADDHGDLGHVPPMAKVIPGRAWKKSERVDLSGADLALLSDDPALKVSAGSFMMLGAGGGAAVFDTLVTTVKDDATAHIETTINGKMQVDLRTVRPTDVVSHGKSHGVMHGTMEGTTVDGTTDGHAQYRYE